MSLHQSNAVMDLVDAPLLVAPPSPTGAEAPALRWDCDPLDPDAFADTLVMTTPRRMMRLAIAAADAAGRFAREGLEVDPVAWMLTPRVVFEGLNAMDACQDLKHFKRSIVLHALGLGLDADPDDIDGLLDDDEDEHDDVIEEDDAHDIDVGYVGLGVETPVAAGATDVRLARPLLLTSWLDVVRDGERLFAFCAIVTDRPGALVERLIERYGRDAEHAEFAVGYDRTSPLATAMISDAVADTLALAAAEPASPLAAGLDVVVEQRFVDWTLAA